MKFESGTCFAQLTRAGLTIGPPRNPNSFTAKQNFGPDCPCDREFGFDGQALKLSLHLLPISFRKTQSFCLRSATRSGYPKSIKRRRWVLHLPL